VRAVALDREGVLPVADLQRLDREAEPLGVAAEHPVHVARPQAGFLTTGATLDLDEHVLVVVGVARDHRQAQLLLECGDLLARVAQHLAQLLVIGPVGQQLLRAGGVILRVPPFDRQPGRGLQLAVRATDLGVALAIGDHRGIDHLACELGEALLDLRDQRADHATTSNPTRSAALRWSPASMSRTERSAAIATASCAWSGSRVVNRCSARPGAIRARTTVRSRWRAANLMISN